MQNFFVTCELSNNSGCSVMRSVPFRGRSCEKKEWNHTCCGPMKSVPPCGSGWLSVAVVMLWSHQVRTKHAGSHIMGPQLGCMRARATRYRTVVLTSLDRGTSDSERNPPATVWWY